MLPLSAANPKARAVSLPPAQVRPAIPGEESMADPAETGEEATRGRTEPVLQHPPTNAIGGAGEAHSASRPAVPAPSPAARLAPKEVAQPLKRGRPSEGRGTPDRIPDT